MTKETLMSPELDKHKQQRQSGHCERAESRFIVFLLLVDIPT